MTRNRARLIVIVVIGLLVLVAAALYFINLYRDSIALEVARTALRDTDVQVSDVSVESISSSEVVFDAIVLELPDGGTVFVEGITLPVRFRGLRDSTLHVRTVKFRPGETDTGPVRFAAVLQNYLDAPAATPGATIRIGEVRLPDLPVVRDVAWHADTLNPTLRATIEGFELFITTTDDSDGTFRGSLRVLMPDDTEALMLGFRIAPDPSGFDVRGNFDLMLEPLLPALRAIGAVPTEVTTLTADLDGELDFRLEADEMLPIDVRATVDTAAGTTMTYRSEATEVALTMVETTPVSVTFQYPSLDWTARVDGSSVAVAGDDFELPILRLRGSECRSGVACRTALDVSYGKLAIGELSIDGVSASAGAVEFASRDDGWQLSSPRTTFILKNPAIAGRRLVTPAVEADLSGSTERMSAAIRLATPHGGLSGRAAAWHDLGAGIGNLVPDWPYDWDVTAGRGTAEAEIGWAVADADIEYEGTAAVAAADLAGRYADIGFLGFNSRLGIKVNSATQLALEPARFEVALVDIGFPVEDISGTATPDIDAVAVDVSSLSMAVLGGTVTADPFRYSLDAARNELLLRASNVQLPLMAGLADLEAVTISGSVSGEIPVTIIVDDTSQLGIVTRTLRNFEFESLTSAVSYSQDGDLVLKMRLKGINPDVDPTQPVILNLNVENNVPQMLRSLQATRSIEDVLEKRLSK
jgi:hypothetical protein